jgi:hypothetical protein
MIEYMTPEFLHTFCYRNAKSFPDPLDPKARYLFVVVFVQPCQPMTYVGSIGSDGTRRQSFKGE